MPNKSILIAALPLMLSSGFLGARTGSPDGRLSDESLSTESLSTDNLSDDGGRSTYSRLSADNLSPGPASEDPPPEEGPFIPRFRTNSRSLGDKSFAITAGIYIPLFTVLLHDWPGGGYDAGIYPPKLSAGGSGSLAFSVYLSSNLKLGLQLAGAFSADINRNFLYVVPVTLKGSWEFHPGPRFSIPLHLAAGVSMTTWKTDNFRVDMILRPGVGFYFDWSLEWSFGIDFTYWFIPQTGGLAKEHERSIGNFMDISLTAEYHF